MNKWVGLLVGAILLIASIVLWITDYQGFGMAALDFLKGGLVWFVLMIGVLFVLLGISDLEG